MNQVNEERKWRVDETFGWELEVCKESKRLYQEVSYKRKEEDDGTMEEAK